MCCYVFLSDSVSYQLTGRKSNPIFLAVIECTMASIQQVEYAE